MSTEVYDLLTKVILYGCLISALIMGIHTNLNAEKVVKKEGEIKLKKGIAIPTGENLENLIKKKKKNGRNIIITCSVVLVLFLSMDLNVINKLAPSSEPPVITTSGISITMGETTPQTLIDGGYEIIDGYEDTVVESYYVSPLVNLHHEDGSSISVAVANDSDITKPMADCFIYKVYHSLYTDAGVSQPVTVNGVMMDDKMTVSSVKTMMEDKKLVEETVTDLKYKDGDYVMQFSIDEDSPGDDKRIDLISVSYEIPIDYSELYE